MNEQNIAFDVARDSFRLIETGDAVLGARIVSEEFVNEEAADDPEDAERQETGVEGFLATSSWLRASFSELHFELQEMAQNGDTVIVASLMQGVHTGEFQRIPPSGRRFSQKQIHVLTILNGQVTRHRAVRDDLGLLFQLGWKPGR